LLAALIALAHAQTLPGIPLTFEVDDGGTWTLPEDLPAAFADAGAEPGWVLLTVDGKEMDEPAEVARRVAAGDAREVQLLFEIPPKNPYARVKEEAILVFPRAPLVFAEDLGALPWPEGFAPPVQSALWRADAHGYPALVDAAQTAWVLDPATGEQIAAAAPEGELEIADLWWALTDAAWAVDTPDGVQTGDAAAAQALMPNAARLESFQGRLGDHLAIPTEEGLWIVAIHWPGGTPPLPICNPAVPETCLTSGRQIHATLAQRPGGREEALHHLDLACVGGVTRGCFEAVALEDPLESAPIEACLSGEVESCHDVASARLALAPDAPTPRTTGLLEYACQVDASGSLGERLRRVEAVGEGCIMLASAYDALGEPDRALLSLDQACVLGRADACEDAEHRRHTAFALRTVRECEDEELPVASACVELGALLQVEPVAATEMDAFDAFGRACELGDEEGCILLGDFVDRWGIEHPRVIAAEDELIAACEGGEQRACLGAAHLLVRHEPRTEAYGQALVVFSGACDAGLASACIAGARQRRIGDARKVEAPEPVDMWTSACDRHSAPGCLGLGEQLARSKKTWSAAFDAWTRSCDIGEPHACTELGLLVSERHPEPWDGEQARDDYLTRGCESGDAEGCYWLAEPELPRKAEPPEPAYVLLERSCEGDFGQGCADLADVHIYRKDSFNDEIAARYYGRACDNGHFDSCKELGDMYLRGKGVERDRARAKELLERFQFNAARKHVRVGLQAGFPYLVGGHLELVAPIPAGPTFSVVGSGTWLPALGTALLFLEGQEEPAQNPDLIYYDAVARLYPNNKARGIYAGVGWHRMSTSGGGLAQPLSRQGFSLRFGRHSADRAFYSNLELGLASYGVVDLNHFDEDETGTFPLIQPTLGISFGGAVL